MNRRQLSSVFSALSDPTRRAIIERLAQGDASAGELAEPFGISKPAISKHLKVLEKANLILRKKEAQWHRFQLRVEPLQAASDWIEQYRQFWEAQLDGLTDFFNNQDPGGIS
jgi:DNA-binding transcriptional ArsR family regulator